MNIISDIEYPSNNILCDRCNKYKAQIFVHDIAEYRCLKCKR